jgi:signal transduction histidine kinase
MIQQLLSRLRRLVSSPPALGSAGRAASGGRAVWPEVALISVSVLLAGATWAIHHNRPDPDERFGVAGVLLLATGIAALPFRHRFPSGVLAVVFFSTLAYVTLGFSGGPIWLPLVVALATVVLAGRRRTAIATLVTGYLAFTWLPYLLGNEPRPNVVAQVVLAAWLVTLLAVSEAVRSRRDRARDAERLRAEALRRRLADERMRIARELHDVVAHNMSLISIQAGVALHLLDEQPDQARDSLGTIKQASKEALVELRSILGVLRSVDEEQDGAVGEGADDGEASSAPRAPVPGLARLDDLVARARSAGVDVRVDAAELGPLPREVDLAAYRIVQECLTNVVRHSGSATAVVRIEPFGGGLEVSVLDEGTGTVGSPGYGIAGMRERAASVGGRLEAGPRPGRGFAVRATLPLSGGDG